jgi:hypothetical protein
VSRQARDTPVRPAFEPTCQGVDRAWWNEWEGEKCEDDLPPG